jgi:hypothetical protein
MALSTRQLAELAGATVKAIRHYLSSTIRSARSGNSDA